MEKEEQRSYQPYYEDDEIDLYELWLVIKKRWKAIVCFVLAFFISASLYITIAKPVYKSEFTLKNVELHSYKNKMLLSPQEIKLYIGKLETLIENKKYDKLSNILRLNKKTLLDLEEVRVGMGRNRSNSPIKIELYTYSPNNLEKFEKAILKYLNSNPYVVKRIDSEKQFILSSISETKKSIRELLKLKIAVQKALKNNNLSSIRFNPADIDEKILNLRKQIAKLELSLKELHYDVKVPVSKPLKPYKPQKALVLSVSTVTGLFLGIFAAFFIEWLESVKSRQYKEKEENL